jgi:arsenite methyltransferase
MSNRIEEVVRDRYGSIAGSGLSSDHSGVRAVAEAFGYSPEELTSIPAQANMGLSCGNPTAYANLRPGETVVDLGSGGGLDVFLAAAKVGPEGRAIGIDMTQEMIALARRNAEKGVDGKPYENVEFHLSTIDKLPLADASVDCVISNCVINLAPDKRAVIKEIARVLKPGGRLAVSDIALKQPLPAEIANDLLAYAGCIAGAVQIEEYRNTLLECGFAHVEVVDTRSDLNAYAKIETEGEESCSAPSISSALPVVATGCCSPEATPSEGAVARRRLADMLREANVNDYAASVRVYAVKE